MENKIPYFIEIRGCRNCDAYLETIRQRVSPNKPKSSLADMCQTKGCSSHGFSLENPFKDPQDFLYEAITSPPKKEDRNKFMSDLREIKDRFGDHYRSMSVSFRDIADETANLLFRRRP